MRSIVTWGIIAAGSLGLFMIIHPGRLAAQTNSTNKVESAPASIEEKEQKSKKSTPAKKAEPPKSFTPTTKVPVGMPIDFPVDI